MARTKSSVCHQVIPSKQGLTGAGCVPQAREAVPPPAAARSGGGGGGGRSGATGIAQLAAAREDAELRERRLKQESDIPTTLPLFKCARPVVMAPALKINVLAANAPGRWRTSHVYSHCFVVSQAECLWRLYALLHGCRGRERSRAWR